MQKLKMQKLKMLKLEMLKLKFSKLTYFSPLIRHVRGHLLLICVRMREDLADQNQTWLVIVTCLLSSLMALRMAGVVGWVHCGPLVRMPLPGDAALIQQSQVFWDSTTNARICCLALFGGCTLTVVSRLERWQIPMLCGLTVLMVWWYATATTMLFQLGVSISGLYWGGAITASIMTIKTYRMFHTQSHREAEVDNAVMLVGQVLDALGVDASGVQAERKTPKFRVTHKTLP